MTIKEIKDYIKSNNITQIELSKKSGVPLGTLRNIFSGRVPAPRLDTITAITNALGIDFEYSQPTIINYRLGFKNQIVIFDNSGDNTIFEFEKEQLNQIIKVNEALTTKK